MFNPVFVLLVFIAAIALWFLLSGSFIAVGRFFDRIFSDAVDVMKEEEKEEDEKNE